MFLRNGLRSSKVRYQQAQVLPYVVTMLYWLVESSATQMQIYGEMLMCGNGNSCWRSCISTSPLSLTPIALRVRRNYRIRSRTHFSFAWWLQLGQNSDAVRHGYTAGQPTVL